MKNKFFSAAVTFMLFIALPNTNCSKDGGDEFFIPIIENQWTNKANPDDKFVINQPDQVGVNSSTFSGNEDSTDASFNTFTFNFTGSFTNHNVQFAFDNNSGYKSGKSYSGTINDASNVLTLHSNDLGDLILEK